MEALPVESKDAQRNNQYAAVIVRLHRLLEGESDLVAAMATVACELHSSFQYFHWTGFYRAGIVDDWLVIGPYQGGHGCLRIPFGKGVCGAAAAQRVTQDAPDVHKFPGHIACSSKTQSEVVVPVINSEGRLLGVLDIDSDHPAAFTKEDVTGLEQVCSLIQHYKPS